MRTGVIVALRITFLVLAAAAIYYSCRINMTALAAIGGANAAFLSSIAVMSAAVKAAVPLYREYFGRVPYSIGAVFVLALVFDAGCALGFSAMTRGAETARQADADARRAHASETAARLRAAIADAAGSHNSRYAAEIERAANRLATLEAAAQRQKFAMRTAAAIAVDIEGAKARAGDCRVRGHTDACQYVVRLQSELADAEGRDAAQSKLDKLREQLAAGPAGTAELQQQLKDAEAALAAPSGIDRDWFAVAVAGVTGMPEAWASRGFAALLTLFIELLAVCGLAVALRPVPATAEPTQLAQPRAHVADAKPTPLEAAATPAVVVPITPKKVAARQGAAVDAVRKWIDAATAAADGWIYTRQRELAAATGVSGAAANTALQSLQAAGAVELRAGRRGTAIRRIA